MYSEQGFGPAYPWGWLHINDSTLGMDSQWHASLEEAFINSGMWSGPMPENYEVP